MAPLDGWSGLRCAYRVFVKETRKTRSCNSVLIRQSRTDLAADAFLLEELQRAGMEWDRGALLHLVVE